MAERSGVTLTLTADDLGSVGRRMRAAVAATQKPSRLMKRIGAALAGSTKRRFRSNVAPDGTPWKPSVRAAAKGGRTLMGLGHLRDSITSDGDDEMAVVGTNLVYGAIHQVGGVIKAKGDGYLTFNIPGVGWRRVRQVVIPARPFLGVSADDRVEIADQVEKYIAQAVA